MFKKSLSLFILTYILLSNSYNLQSANMSVVLKEKGSREFIIGGTVILYDYNNPTKILTGGRTNKFGFTGFSSLDAGKYILISRSVGYMNHIDTIKLSSNEDLKKKVFLKSKLTETDEITIIGKKMAGDIKSISKATITSDFILNMPAIGSEPDILRSMQLLPGVSASSEISSGLNIRGGTSDQTLYRLDGVTVYNPTHLGGFIGAFNADATRDVELIKGAFPAEFGGRLSGILDVTMKEGSKEKFQGVARASIISASAEIEGPITEDISYMISARRFYFDYLINMMASGDDTPPSYYFYDLNTKLNWEIDDNNHLFVSSMFSQDVFNVDFGSRGGKNQDESDDDADDDKMESGWGNKIANIRYMHIFSPKLFTNFSLIYSTYSFDTDMTMSSGGNDDDGKKKKRPQMNLGIENGIEDIVFRSTADWFGFKNHKIRTGFDITHHNFNIFSLETEFDMLSDSLNKEINDSLNQFSRPSSKDISVYIDDEWEIHPLLNAGLGLRANYYPDGDYKNIEPRFSLSYQFQENMFLRTAITNSHQSEHLIRRSDINFPTDVWVPSNETIKPSESWQYTIGYETSFFDKYLFSIEGYYKTMTDLYEYKDTAEIFSSDRIEKQLTDGKGKAYGLEFFLHKRSGKLQGWIGYTLSEVLYQFEEINQGKEFHPLHDQLHNFKITATYDINKDWKVSANWVYSSGQPVTMPTGSYITTNEYGFEETKYNYTEKNGYRMPAYHRMDLSITDKFTGWGLPWELSLNIYNVYNRKNPFTMYIDKDDYGKTVLRQFSLFGILPTLGISCKF